MEVEEGGDLGFAAQAPGVVVPLGSFGDGAVDVRGDSKELVSLRQLTVYDNFHPKRCQKRLQNRIRFRAKCYRTY